MSEIKTELQRLKEKYSDKAISYLAGHVFLKHSREEALELRDRIKQLEQELAEAKKDQARYKLVKTMTYDEFGEMSHDPVRFDEQVDAAIKESK